jgi:hypothetical protein
MSTNDSNNPFKPSIIKSKLYGQLEPNIKASDSGVGNKPQQESKFIYSRAGNESVLGGGDRNAYIVFGSDRPDSTISGYGGEGGTQCNTIDIVVGRGSAVAPALDPADNIPPLYISNNFVLDAARVYISQKTDVDTNFGLVDGKVGNSKAKSAIALKADGLRFIARDGIKFVTKTDLKNSAGKDVDNHYGIDLIANNDDSNLQQMVLGNSLASCLEELITEIDKLQNRVGEFIDQQQIFNDKIANHTHYSLGLVEETTISPQLAVQNGLLKVKKFLSFDVGYYLQKTNFIYLINKYLQNGKSSILSKYNRVN